MKINASMSGLIVQYETLTAQILLKSFLETSFRVFQNLSDRFISARFILNARSVLCWSSSFDRT